MERVQESQLLQLLLIFALVILAVTKVTLQGAASRRHIRGTVDSVLFNAQLFAVIAVVMAIMFGAELPSWQGLLLVLCSAIGTFLFQVSYALALQCGPVSLSVLIVNFNVLLTTTFSVIVYKDPVYLSHLIGIAFLVISLLLSIKKEENAKAISGKWLVLLATALIGTATGTIITQVFTKSFSDSAKQDNGFVILVYVAASLMAFAWYFAGALGKGKKRCTYGFWNKHMWLLIVLIGVVLGVFQKLYMSGMKYIDGAFLFPTFSGMQSLAMTFVGIVFFKDKLSVRQMVGVVFGIACVVMMNLKFVVLMSW
ncbi:MAG: EamA family transporter [Clostridia bacterium]|nr:EamA family transporter [Clostridia bacterium]